MKKTRRRTWRRSDLILRLTTPGLSDLSRRSTVFCKMAWQPTDIARNAHPFFGRLKAEGPVFVLGKRVKPVS